MEQRHRQQPRQRANQIQMRDQTMQARQTEIDKIVEQQQQTAIILERVLGRLDSVEKWQQTEERAKERAEERRDERQDAAPDGQRANLALMVSAITAVIYLLTFLAPHWK